MNKRIKMKFFLYILILFSAIEISYYRITAAPQVTPENTTLLKEDFNPLSRFILKENEPDTDILRSGKDINTNPEVTFHYHYKILSSGDSAQVIIHLSEIYNYSFARAP